MARLSDGTIKPHFLSSNPSQEAQRVSSRDTFLRVGRVIGAYPPSDPLRNVSKQYMEYDVEVDMGGGVVKVYPNAIMTDPLGGAADYFEFTPRISQGKASDQIDLGTRVLLLCANGLSSQAAIIGGVKHHGRATTDTVQDGHHLTFNFNGVNANIDKDGTFTLKHLGATSDDGTVINQNAYYESSFSMRPKGDIYLWTGNADTNGSTTQLHFDSVAESIKMSASEINITADASNGPGNIVLDSSGVLTGAATDHTMMGDTYRSAQEALHTNLMAQLVIAQTAAATASVSLGAAAVANAIPMFGGIPAAPFFLTASVQMSIIGAAMAAMQIAITNFEMQGPLMLSLKNKSD